MLKSITMRNVATYDNVGVTFDDLNKVNLIYGPNGTGKTTISNYLKHYSKNRIAGEAIPPQFSGCQVQWDRVTSPEVIVYNRAFKKENIGKQGGEGLQQHAIPIRHMVCEYHQDELYLKTTCH